MLRKGVFEAWERCLVLSSNLGNIQLSRMTCRSVKCITKFKYRNTETGRVHLADYKRRVRAKRTNYV